MLGTLYLYPALSEAGFKKTGLILGTVYTTIGICDAMLHCAYLNEAVQEALLPLADGILQPFVPVFIAATLYVASFYKMDGNNIATIVLFLITLVAFLAEPYPETKVYYTPGDKFHFVHAVAHLGTSGLAIAQTLTVKGDMKKEKTPPASEKNKTNVVKCE